jgi:hypothetical protein
MPHAEFNLFEFILKKLEKLNSDGAIECMSDTVPWRDILICQSVKSRLSSATVVPYSQTAVFWQISWPGFPYKPWELYTTGVEIVSKLKCISWLTVIIPASD